MLRNHLTDHQNKQNIVIIAAQITHATVIRNVNLLRQNSYFNLNRQETFYQRNKFSKKY
jgi:hypothetical protein